MNDASVRASTSTSHSMFDASHGRVESKVGSRGVGGISMHRMNRGGLSLV